MVGIMVSVILGILIFGYAAWSISSSIKKVGKDVAQHAL